MSATNTDNFVHSNSSPIGSVISDLMDDVVGVTPDGTYRGLINKKEVETYLKELLSLPDEDKDDVLKYIEFLKYKNEQKK